ncbi:MAG TPA: hypothetical protein VMD99_09565 [Terriglobales bacterium]|nr:hypothetical protein [Terriglobales bacterium]
MKRIACNGIGLVLLLGVAGFGTGAQAQSGSNQAAPAAQSSASSAASGTSLGDYARQIRKNSPTNAKPKVFDNDNLPTQDKLSIVGQAPTDDSSEAKADDSEASSTSPDGTASNGAKAGSDKSGPPAKLPEDDAAKQAAIKQWSDKISSQKDAIDLTQRELNVLQREYQIRAAAMYGDVGNRLRNSADWDKQDAQYKQQIADKQKALDDAKQKLDDTEEDARKAGVPDSAAEPQ